MPILARAPAKAILFGEHYVVYGAPGLVAAIEPCNEIGMEAKKADAASAGFEYHSTIKENDVKAGLRPSSSALQPEGRLPVHPYAALYHKLARELPALRHLRIRAQVKYAWPLKGVGNSASLGAALGAGFRKIGGEKKTAPSSLFEDAQTADEVAHGGGRPSGIDAAAASYGGVIEFEKNFKMPQRPEIRALKIAPMKGAEFLLIGTLAAGEKRGSTAELIAGFARAHGIEKKPGELNGKERRAVFAPYLPLFIRARRALGIGDWKEVGRLMDENHRMLKEKGVSSPRIERAVSICKSSGALGAKLSGAGGPGGVVIALVGKRGSPPSPERSRWKDSGPIRLKSRKKARRHKKIDGSKNNLVFA
jgi:mevalonate kinase